MYMKSAVTSMSKKIIVIGAGAAGLMAAGTAAKCGAEVILIEKNPLNGKKLRITGKGRCNITNTADMSEFIKNVPTNGKFLYSAFSRFTNEDLISLLNSLGLKTKEERGGRVFPVSDRAKDVVEALEKYALAENTRLVNTKAKELIIENGCVKGVKTSDGEIYADAVILATGGKSYPLTGSTGDGYKMAQKAGHTVTELKPSLIPIVTEEKWVKQLMGLSLKNVKLTVYNSKNKAIYSDFGEMLFTHFGISGPIVLSASAHLRKMEKEHYTVKIDLKPALDMQQLDKRLMRDFEKFSRKHFINSLDELLPKALIPVIIEMSGIDPHIEVNSITKEQRRFLASLLKELTLTVKGFRPIEEAIITSGGIKVAEIVPATMESKLVRGLYFAGEIIDVDAYTGGFNLQIAFSTGYLAAISAAEDFD